MEFAAEEIDIGTRSPTVLLNAVDAAELGVHPLDRVQLRKDGRTTIGIVELTDELVAPGTLGLTRRLRHLTGRVEVTVAPQPDSVHYIRKKLDDVELERPELDRIVRDVNEDRLSDVELGAYVAGIYTNGLSLAETMHLTESMAAAGDALSWEGEVVADKHSIGGVAGNRVTPIV
ncbi:MAG: AMP phosphorylase, partial [Salinigranum sp.]